MSRDIWHYLFCFCQDFWVLSSTNSTPHYFSQLGVTYFPNISTNFSLLLRGHVGFNSWKKKNSKKTRDTAPLKNTIVQYKNIDTLKAMSPGSREWAPKGPRSRAGPAQQRPIYRKYEIWTQDCLMILKEPSF